jgi:Fe2+ transport system protein FeoA
MKLTNVPALLLAIILPSAFVLGACRRPAPQSGIVGKWRTADGSYAVDFLPSGDCSARYILHGRELGGPCKYSVDKDDITIRWHRPEPGTPDNSPNASVKWHYALAGDVLTVSVAGNSVTLRRAN